MNNSQHSSPETSVGFSAGPAEAVIGLHQVSDPMVGISILYARKRPTFNASAVNLPERTHNPQPAEERWWTG
jgi:hypothetical protein